MGTNTVFDHSFPQATLPIPLVNAINIPAIHVFLNGSSSSWVEIIFRDIEISLLDVARLWKCIKFHPV